MSEFNPIKIPEPLDLLPDGAQDGAWSADGRLLAFAHSVSPYVTVYERFGSELVKISGFDAFPAGNGNAVSWSPNGRYLAVAHDNSPYFTVYERKGNLFTKLDDPDSVPAGACESVSWHPLGRHLAVGYVSSPYASIYRISETSEISLDLSFDDFGSNPVKGLAYSVKFSNQGDVLSVGFRSSPFMVNFEFTILGDDEFRIDALDDPSNLPIGTSGNSVRDFSWTPDDRFLALAFTTTPYVIVYEKDGNTFTKLDNPSTLPTNPARAVAFSESSRYLFFAQNTSSQPMLIYERSGTTFTQIDVPAAVDPPGLIRKIDISEGDRFMALSHSASPYFSVYRFGEFRARLMPTLRQRFFDSRGEPLAFGKLYSYLAGTTTPARTFSDQSSHDINSNPIILDESGEADVWLDNFSYKFRLEDSKGVIQWTIDGVDSQGIFAPGSVTKDKLGAFSVDEESIAVGAVTRRKIRDAAVDNDKIRDGAITQRKIQDSSLTFDKVSNEIVFRLSTEGRLLPRFEWDDPQVLLGATDTIEIQTGRGAAWTPDGRFLAVAHNTSGISIYERFRDSFIEIDLSDVEPSDQGNSVDWSHDGKYLAVGLASSPYLLILKRDGSKFTELDGPSTNPVGSSGGVSWSHDSRFLAVPHSGSPQVSIYERSGDSFSKLSNPAALPAGNGIACHFSDNGKFIAVAHGTSPYVTIYEISGTTFTKLSDPNRLPAGTGRGVKFSPDGKFMVVAHSSSPYITIYSISGNTFTKLDNPSSLPNGVGRDLSFSDESNLLAVGHSTSPYLTVYSISGNTFTKLPTVDDPPTFSCNGLAFSPDDRYLAFAGSGTEFAVYKTSGELRSSGIIVIDEE